MKDKSEQILSRNINIFLVGYLLYSFAFVLTRTNPSYLIYIANELLCFLGLAMVIFSLMASIRMKNSVNGYVKVIEKGYHEWGLPLEHLERAILAEKERS